MRRLLCWLVGHGDEPEVDHGPNKRWAPETRYRFVCHRCGHASAWAYLFTERERTTLRLVDKEQS